MTIEIHKNTENIIKSEGITGGGLTGEVGSGKEFVPIGMPGAYKYKLKRKKDNDLSNISA